FDLSSSSASGDQKPGGSGGQLSDAGAVPPAAQLSGSPSHAGPGQPADKRSPGDAPQTSPLSPHAPPADSLQHPPQNATPAARASAATHIPGAPQPQISGGASAHDSAEAAAAGASPHASQQTWDWIIIDCPPSLGLLTVNGLVAARWVLVPVLCERMAVRSIPVMLSIIESVAGRYNAHLNLAGIVANDYSERVPHARAILEELRAQYRDAVLPTVIRHSNYLMRVHASGQSIFQVASHSNPATDFLSLAAEISIRLSAGARQM
ncbi:MAG: AAA family ATPase, partial [Candidatus Korarchaeota archaeon]|nr:AAA family ATPase [Candidatus Korarchaeota archaeon]